MSPWVAVTAPAVESLAELTIWPTKLETLLTCSLQKKFAEPCAKSPWAGLWERGFSSVPGIWATSTLPSNCRTAVPRLQTALSPAQNRRWLPPPGPVWLLVFFPHKATLYPSAQSTGPASQLLLGWQEPWEGRELCLQFAIRVCLVSTLREVPRQTDRDPGAGGSFWTGTDIADFSRLARELTCLTSTGPQGPRSTQLLGTPAARTPPARASSS